MDVWRFETALEIQNNMGTPLLAVDGVISGVQRKFRVDG